MRGAGIITLQIPAAAVGLAAVSGLTGFLVVQFAGWSDAATGFGWGMIFGGGLVGFAAAGSGSPSENLGRGRTGQFATYWGEGSALPTTPLQVVFAGALTFAGGVALIVLTYQ
jgi:hypothetical protein